MSGIGAIGYSGYSRLYAAWQNSWSAMSAQRAAAASSAASAAASSSVAAAPSVPASGETALSSVAQSAANTASSLPAVYPERRLPGEEELNNASEWMVRLRIQYPEGESPEQTALRGKLAGLEDTLSEKEGELAGLKKDAPVELEEAKSAAEVFEESECQTCAKRKYQDGSDDPGVSFKTPTKISPDAAESAVRGHEQEHVVRERAEAEREGRKVVSQSVTIHTDICPECGRVYISGGTTRTVTANDLQSEMSWQPEEEETPVAV